MSKDDQNRTNTQNEASHQEESTMPQESDSPKPALELKDEQQIVVVVDNNVDQALRILTRKVQREQQ